MNDAGLSVMMKRWFMRSRLVGVSSQISARAFTWSSATDVAVKFSISARIPSIRLYNAIQSREAVSFPIGSIMVLQSSSS
jgi:hypothetical protein